MNYIGNKELLEMRKVGFLASRKIPKQYEEAMQQHRILFISNEKDTVTRVSEVSAHKRNEYVRNLADEMKMSEDGFETLFQSMLAKCN